MSNANASQGAGEFIWFREQKFRIFMALASWRLVVFSGIGLNLAQTRMSLFASLVAIYQSMGGRMGERGGIADKDISVSGPGVFDWQSTMPNLVRVQADRGDSAVLAALVFRSCMGLINLRVFEGRVVL